MYGPLIIAYLFLGGTAAGALFVMSVWSLQTRLSSVRAPRQETAFAALRRRTYAAAFVLLVLAMTCLLWDLGAPHRAPLIFLHSRPTVLTFGAYTLAIEAVLTVLLAATYLLKRPALQGSALTIAEFLCSVGAIVTMSYTGVFLMSGGIPFWNTWALVGLFTFSSISAGVSTVLLIDWFIQGQTLLLRASKPLQRWHLGCLAGETVFLALFTYDVLSNPSANAARTLLLSPDMLATAVVGVAGFGITLPAALETYSLTRKDCRTIPVSDVACLLGCLILRYVVIACGVH
ncbi:hypothetical protein FIC87_14305 [Eggerthella lenta]|uniref:Polysulfide reductase n=1 Tax=Eggerthella lenta TaxID=84112 RepID=A0A5C5BPI4_EGGLN|nr:NrfD/PsrC family molybdoenzyme membrane anchor subunit [Eggerthella lenta]TNU88570.1 hypothetical protein FIC87_14305 [Eggerthella lenta]